MKDLIKSYPGLEHIEVLSIKHWTKKTFSFKCVRPKNLRFRSGEFVMIGLENGDKPLLRAYSIASPSWDEILEFYSIKVEDGPLTSRLQHLVEGDNIFLKKVLVIIGTQYQSSYLYLYTHGFNVFLLILIFKV